MDVLSLLKNKVVVSVQAMPDEPLYAENCMSAMMESVVMGGAGALRVAGARDVKIAKSKFNLPVIGLTKPNKLPENWRDVVYITPTLEDVDSLVFAGADIVAFDGTLRDRLVSVSDFVKHIHSFDKLAMADIATLEEGLLCAKLGVDVISTTLSGYTQESLTDSHLPDFELLAQLVAKTSCPIVLEGRIWEIEHVKKAFELGAHCVVIGSAITRPQLITKRFIQGVC